MSRKDPFIRIGSTLLFLLLLLFVLYPLLSVFLRSLEDENGLSLRLYREILTEAYYSRALRNSLSLGAVSATLATLTGYIFALAVHRFRIRGRNFFRIIAYLPLLAPPFMFALSVILLLGNSGLVTAGLLGIENPNLYGFGGLLLVQSLSFFPLSYMILTGIVTLLSGNLEAAAMNLGSSPFRTFFTVTLPLTTPGLFASWLLTFTASLTDFANPLIIGGDWQVLSVQAYLEFSGMGNLPRGTALAVLLLIPSLGVWFLRKRLTEGRDYGSLNGRDRRRTPLSPSPGTRSLLFMFCLMISLFLIVIFLTLVACSFIRIWGADWSPTLEHYIYSYDVGFTTLLNTLFLALIATPLTACSGIFIAFLSLHRHGGSGRRLEFLSHLGYAVPGTVMGIGYVLSFNTAPFHLSGTAFILIALFTFRNLPVAVEAGAAALQQISPELEESAASLGAGNFYNLRHMIVPLIMPSFLAGAAYAFIRSMTAFSAVIFLISARWNHMSVLILAQTEIMRLGTAAVMASSLILLIALVIGALSLLLRFKPGMRSALSRLTLYFRPP